MKLLYNYNRYTHRQTELGNLRYAILLATIIVSFAIVFHRGKFWYIQNSPCEYGDRQKMCSGNNQYCVP